MALKLTGRNPAKFEFDDGVSQTLVVIQPDDAPDVVRAKLQRVLELEGAVIPTAPAARMVSVPAEPEFTAADRAAMDAQLAKAQPNGWESYDVEQLPEA